jgi:uncharacterized protein (TIGR02231 family)
MRFPTTTALALCLPATAFADDILLRADIAEALVFAQGAEVSRSVMADLPAGRHTLLIPMRDLTDPDLIEVTAPGGVRVAPAQQVPQIAIPEGELDTEAEAASRDAVETAEDALQAAQDALARRDAEIEGLETQIAYLTALSRGGDNGAEMPADPARLTEILATLGEETARVGTELQAAREARREDEEAIEARARELAEAERAFQSLKPFGTEAPGISIAVDVPDDVSGVIELAYLTDGASWNPAYALRLDTETARLDIERSIRFSWRGEAVWRDVDTRFSTAIPNRRRTPGGVMPDPARIMPPVPPAPEPALRGGAADLMESEAAMAPVMVEEAAQMVSDGLSVVYDYAAPVTVGPTGNATLPFDDLVIEVELENRAVPRRDSTAYLVAMGENTTGEAILPGSTRFFRDGDLVGAGHLPMIPAGGEAEMAFGPLDHLPLIWQDLSLDEGDRGVFVSENAQRRRIVFGVENTSDEAESVRLLYATPFAEQEDLDVSVEFSSAPDERDVDDLRGVDAWNLDVAAGAENRIEMTVELSWPEDMVLDWQP